MTMNAAAGTPRLTPGIWKADPNHSGVNFRIRHLGLSNVRGRFDRFDATLTVGSSMDEVTVTARIDMASVNTNQPDRDNHLRSTDFFSVEKRRDMTFQSKTVIERGHDQYELIGELTINDITREISLDVQFNGIEVFMQTRDKHAGFAATGEINRDDFGIDFNMPLGAGKVALSRTVAIELDFQFIAP